MLIDKLKERAKQNKKRITLAEGEDIRVLKAAEACTKENIAYITLLGNIDNIISLANTNNIDLSGIEIIDPSTASNLDDYVNKLYELRKHKGITLEDAKEKILNNYVYYGCLDILEGKQDGVVSGAIHSTADTLRPALEIIKGKERIVSSFFLMELENSQYGEEGTFVYSDCGLIQNPSSEELSTIAYEAAESFKILTEKTPYIAFLSHSTKGSSKCDDSTKVIDAFNLFKEEHPHYIADGEMQFDAAIIKEIGDRKAPNSPVAGKANTLIFPDLDAGNIAYKITERLAGAAAYGPITQGLNYPVNDLSRGSTVEDIIGVIVITCLQAK